MNIPQEEKIKVYSNGKWKDFRFIGAYGTDNGATDDEERSLIFPTFIDEIESWNEIKEDLSPVEIINHLSFIDELDDARFIEYYGVTFYTNYLKAKNEIDKLNSILEDELKGLNQDNVCYVHTRISINFNKEFIWSPNCDWARNGTDFIILFEDEGLGSRRVYLFEKVYDEVIDLLEKIWNKLLGNEI
jgi:hypothetical protein